MIVRGVIANGGFTAESGGELFVRISVKEMASTGLVTPATLRGREAVLVLGDSPLARELAIAQFSSPEAAIPDGDDSHMVDAATTAPTVEET